MSFLIFQISSFTFTIILLLSVFKIEVTDLEISEIGDPENNDPKIETFISTLKSSIPKTPKSETPKSTTPTSKVFYCFFSGIFNVLFANSLITSSLIPLIKSFKLLISFSRFWIVRSC